MTESALVPLFKFPIARCAPPVPPVLISLNTDMIPSLLNERVDIPEFVI
jgi:hypothetical protein